MHDRDGAKHGRQELLHQAGARVRVCVCVCACVCVCVHINAVAAQLQFKESLAAYAVVCLQVGLLVVMAQVGCFVPAKSMKLTVFTNIFTRYQQHVC